MHFVHSAGDDIQFSVHRLILGERQSPFRAFALTEGYQLHLSNALLVRDEIVLSNGEMEVSNRIQFVNDLASRIEIIRKEHEGQAQVNTSFSLAQRQLSVNEIERKQQQDDVKTYDIKIDDYMNKLRNFIISSNEAMILFKYLKAHKSKLDVDNFSLQDIKVSAMRALGKIGDASIRQWLVEIVDL